jgi:hypothetical protein
MSRICSAFAAGLLLLTILGCETAIGPLAQVQGRVTFKGQSLPGGSIVFSPDPQRGNRGSFARGEIGPDGTYTLQTGDLPGVVSGWHRVTIVAVEPAAVPAPGEVFAVPRSLLPGRYGDPELSGLTAEVRTGRDNQLNFDLE